MPSSRGFARPMPRRARRGGHPGSIVPTPDPWRGTEQLPRSRPERLTCRPCTAPDRPERRKSPVGSRPAGQPGRRESAKLHARPSRGNTRHQILLNRAGVGPAAPAIAVKPAEPAHPRAPTDVLATRSHQGYNHTWPELYANDSGRRCVVPRGNLCSTRSMQALEFRGARGSRRGVLVGSE